jgi:hypothetical protein
MHTLGCILWFPESIASAKSWVIVIDDCVSLQPMKRAAGASNGLAYTTSAVLN